MTVYEPLSLAVSLLAVSVAVLAYLNSRRTDRKTERIATEQLAIQKALANTQLRAAAVAAEAQTRAEVTAEFRRTAGKSMHRVVLRNDGLAEARNVNLEFVLKEGQESPLMDEEHLPIEVLEPGAEYPLRVVTSSNWVPPAPVVVSWLDPDGHERSRKVIVDG